MADLQASIKRLIPVFFCWNIRDLKYFLLKCEHKGLLDRLDVGNR